MKKFWARHRNKIIGTVVIKVTMMLCFFIWIGIKFGVLAVQVVNNYPKLIEKVDTVVKTVDSLDKAPIEIQNEMTEIKQEQRAIKLEQQHLKEDVEDIKDYQKLILEKLIQIQNGHE